MMMTEDMELVRQYAAHGSEEAFATLVSRYVNLVYSVALRQLGDAHLAEEATQATFVILARKAGSLGPTTVVSAWLCRTAQYVAAAALRNQRRRQNREQEVHMQSLLNSSEPEVSPWPDVAPLLDLAMAGLGEKDHSAIVLRYFEGKDLKQVGVALGVSENAAKTRVSRAVEKLRRFLSKRGVTLSAAMMAGVVTANSVQAAPFTLAKSVTAIAITKGATASGSTLGLIKGGLKLMAWAKAKIAVMVGGAVLIGAGATMVAVQSDHVTSALAPATPGPNIQGAWQGTIMLDAPGLYVPGAKRGETAHCRVVFKIDNTNGVYSASGEEIDLGITNVPVSKVSYAFPTVRLEIGPWGTFTGKVNPEATEMTFPMGNYSSVFTRTNVPDTVPERLTKRDFAPRDSSPLQGYWVSRIGRRPNGAPVYWKIAELPDGTFRGEMDRPTLYLGAHHWPVAVTNNLSKVTIKPLTGAGMFQGKLNSDGSEITGMWYEGGGPTFMTLKRADYKPETPVPESAYAFSAKTDLPGHWRTMAVVNVGPVMKQPLNLDIALLPDGTYSPTLGLPACRLQGMGDPLPATSFKFQFQNIHVEWESMGIVFDGKLSDGKLAGKWSKDGAAIAMTFERGQTP